MLSKLRNAYTLEERTMWTTLRPIHVIMRPYQARKLTAPRRMTAWSCSTETTGGFTTSLLDSGVIAHNLQTTDKGDYRPGNTVLLLQEYQTTGCI